MVLVLTARQFLLLIKKALMKRAGATTCYCCV
jgi:hypothetical protein